MALTEATDEDAVTFRARVLPSRELTKICILRIDQTDNWIISHGVREKESARRAEPQSVKHIHGQSAVIHTHRPRNLRKGKEKLVCKPSENFYNLKKIFACGLSKATNPRRPLPS